MATGLISPGDRPRLQRRCQHERIRRCNVNKLKPVPEWTPNPRPLDDTSTFQEHRSWLQLQIVLLICRFTPSCPEIVRILSLGMDKQLSLMMRMKLRIHYLMCSFCHRYMKQLKYIREVPREFPDTPEKT